MKKLMLFIFMGMYYLFYPLTSFADETSMHYSLAEKYFKEHNYEAAARILQEIVYYYDTENLQSYQLLFKVYKKLGDKEGAEEIKELYSKTKKAVTAKKENIKINLSISEILEIGLPKQKVEACKTISDTQDEKFIPQLISLFSDKYFNFYFGKYEVRDAAIINLASFGSKAVPYLIKSFDSSNPNIRQGIIETLKNIKTNNISEQKQINDIIVLALKDSYNNVKLSAVKAAGETKNTAAIPEIIFLLSDQDAKIKLNAAIVLGNLCAISKEYSKQSIEALLKLLEYKDKAVVNEAVNAIVKIGGEEISDVLLKIAKDESKDSIARWYAIRGMGKMLSKKNTAELEKFLDNEDFGLRSAAAIALGTDAHCSKIDDKILKKEKDIIEDTALIFSLKSPTVYEEARLAGINKGLKYLESIQKDDGSFVSYFPLGTTELAVLCFQKQGYKEDYPLIKRGINYILSQKKSDGSIYSVTESAESGDKKITFTTALGIKVLAGTHSAKYKDIIKDAVNWIKNVQNQDGGFGYYKDSRSDITCTTFALQALDEGYKYWGMEKNDETWIKALAYLKEMQNKDGGFGYKKDFKKESYGSATASGFLSLYQAGGTNDKTKDKAIDWLSKNYNWNENPFDDNPKHYQYYIWELAKAFHFNGQEVIKDKEGNNHLWFQDVVKKLLSEQNKNGSWVTDKEPLFTTYLLDVLQMENLKQSLKSM